MPKIKTKEEAILKINTETIELFEVAENLCNDFEIVEKAIRLNPNNYKFASIELKNNKELALLTVQTDGLCLVDLPRNFKEDKEIITAALSQNGGALRYASDKFRANREYIELALKNCGLAIRWAYNFIDETTNLKINPCEDFDLAMLAVKSDALSLSYLSEKLSDNREIVITAVKNDPEAIRFAGTNCIKDLQILHLVVKKDPKLIMWAEQEIFSKCCENPLKSIEKLMLSQNLSHELSSENLKIKKIKI